MSKKGVLYFKIIFFLKKMLMGLTAVKKINCNQTKFVLHQRGRWKLLPWTQVEHMRQGGCAKIPAKIFSSVLWLSIRMSRSWSKRKTQGSRTSVREV